MPEGSPLRLLRRWDFYIWLAIAAFMLWFSIQEGDGLLRMARLILNAIGDVPSFWSDVFGYYQNVPSEQLWPSVVMGAVAGALLTWGLLLGRAGVVKWPRLVLGWIGLLAAGIGIWILGLTLTQAALVGFGLALGLSLAVDPELRDFFSAVSLRKMLRGLLIGRGFWLSLQGLVIGGLGGALGSQLLMYPTEHCTFGADMPQVQYDLGLVITLIGVLVVLLPIWTLMLGRGVQRYESSAGYFRSSWLAYTLLLPTLLNLIVFLYYPAVDIIRRSLFLSFRGVPRQRFVCLGNYVDLANDNIYQNSFTVTLFITVALVVLTMSISLAIAVLASQKVRGAGVYRTLLIWPFALSPVVTGVIFRAMFREGSTGLINFGLDGLFGIQARWLTDPDLAPWVIIMAAVWNSLGFNILFYIAGLQNVPKDLLEAAAIDGANVGQRFFRITLPLLSPFTFFLLVTNITFAFYGIYGVVDAITAGRPPLGPGGIDGGATEVLIYKLYADAFTPSGPMGSAAAQSLILFVFVAVLTVLQFRFGERRVTYSA